MFKHQKAELNSLAKFRKRIIPLSLYIKEYEDYKICMYLNNDSMKSLECEYVKFDFLKAF